MEQKDENPVQKETEKVKVSIADAVSGNRERGWTIQNKCRQIGQLKDGLKVPVISLYYVDPTDVPEDSWQIIQSPEKRNFLCCQKTILLLSECVMQPELDASEQVVLRMHILAPKDEGITKSIFWKQTWGKYMHLGSMSWEDLKKDVKKKQGNEELSLKDLSLADSSTSSKESESETTSAPESTEPGETSVESKS